MPRPTRASIARSRGSSRRATSSDSSPGPTDGIHVPEAFLGVSNQADFIAADYTQEEYFFSGTATAYERDPTAPAWTSDGVWTARPSTTIPPAAYASRMLVRRPTDPSKFNGYVVVEWLNVTASIDLAPDYGYYRTELLRVVEKCLTACRTLT